MYHTVQLRCPKIVGFGIASSRRQAMWCYARHKHNDPVSSIPSKNRGSSTPTGQAPWFFGRVKKPLRIMGCIATSHIRPNITRKVRNEKCTTHTLILLFENNGQKNNQPCRRCCGRNGKHPEEPSLGVSGFYFLTRGNVSTA